MAKWKHALVLVAALLCSSAFAKPPAPAAPAASAQADEAQLVEHGHYVNKFGRAVHSPVHSVDGSAPNGATAKCRDGTRSFSQHHRGTCSHYGCVAGWD
jgi:hypothetical protein